MSVPIRVTAYNSGEPYRPARGQLLPVAALPEVTVPPPVIDIARDQPSWAELWPRLERELRLRFYQPRSIKNYRTALRGLAVWFRRSPDLLTSEHLREYLVSLLDRDEPASASWISINISAARTCLDKLGGLSTTAALATPRRARSLPHVLDESDVKRLLLAAPTVRDKLLLGLLYACGLRVSECCRLRWQDLDVDRGRVRVLGKGRKQREVPLPLCFHALVRLGRARCAPASFVFAGARDGRHLSPRAAELLMARAARIAGLQKRATPHTLRHSYATHLLEHGTDARFIQELLGHARLETTRIYLHVARPQVSAIGSPLDRIGGADLLPPAVAGTRALAPAPPAQPLGLSVDLGPFTADEGRPCCALKICLAAARPPLRLDGARVIEPRTGWITLELPMLDVWEPELARLAPEERARFESAQFYEALRALVTPRFLARRAAAPSSG